MGLRLRTEVIGVSRVVSICERRVVKLGKKGLGEDRYGRMKGLAGVGGNVGRWWVSG